MIAASFPFRKSYPLVPLSLAASYSAFMRGTELKAVRLANLKRLRDQFTLEKIAEKTNTNAVYLSQITNEVVQKGGKTPRSLSDAYAAKIEAGLGLPLGWMDQPHDALPDRPAPTQQPAEDSPVGTAAPALSLSALLDALAVRLARADPVMRAEIAGLMLRYMEQPESGARIAQAIELLLTADDDPPA